MSLKMKSGFFGESRYAKDIHASLSRSIVRLIIASSMARFKGDRIRRYIGTHVASFAHHILINKNHFLTGYIDQ